MMQKSTIENRPIIAKYKIESPNNRKKKWAMIKINDYLTKYEINKLTGEIRYIRSKVHVKVHMNSRYPFVILKLEDDKPHSLFVHRIYAGIYLQIPDKYIRAGYEQQQLSINHKDGNKENWSLDNLEWCTPQENTVHAFRTGLAVTSTGEKSHLSKISEKTAHKICQLISEGKNNEYIVNELKDLNVSKKTIQHIRARECWKNVSKDYTFPKLSDSIPNTMNEKTIRKICRLLEKKKYSDPEIAKKCNVKREYVKDIRTHRRRKDISKDYNF